MTLVSLNKRKLFTTSEKEVTEELVSNAIDIHRSKLLKNYLENEDMYTVSYTHLTLPTIA